MATGVSIPYQLCQRRCGDVDELWANISKANAKLFWKPTRSLADMCKHTWNWQSKNPLGYRAVPRSGLEKINDQVNGDKGPETITRNDSVKVQQPPVSANLTNNRNIAIKAKALNGKAKSFEVNNNDEEVAAFE